MTSSGVAPSIVNISCYKFVAISDLDTLRTRIRRRAVELGLRGTVLISSEGINLFVAGARTAIDEFVAFLRAEPGFGDLAPKESLSDYQPFNRMLVRIKKEIIAFGVDGVEPGVRTSPKLPARELKRWLDEGRRIHLLDTRNDYEVALGTFDRAIQLNIDHFREFPEAINSLPNEMRDEPIVMFCTGGIRCEKAGPMMEMAGFRNVYQLDGGILKYFEEVGGDHYHGDCFVFDQRVAVDPQLRETGTAQCFICQAVVTVEQQKSPQYVVGKSCPSCFRSDEDMRREQLEQRQRRLAEVTSTLPGSVAADSRRPLNVPGRCAGMTLIDFVCDVLPQVARTEWQELIRTGRVVPALSRRPHSRRQIELPVPLDEQMIVREGQRFDRLEFAVEEPPVSAAIEILHEDDDLLVIHKPAPLPVHASGRFERNTLRNLLNLAWFPVRPHITHRLDANTSGVMVLALKKSMAGWIQKQFEQQTVRKDYLARVHGSPADEEWECRLSLSSEPGEGGIRLPDAHGDDAWTRFRVLRRLPDGTSLIHVMPHTGRTNQIRIHLWAMGYPICGDPAYLTHGQTGTSRTLLPDEPAMCLHAWRIQLRDRTGSDRVFEAPLPKWAQESIG